MEKEHVVYGAQWVIPSGQDRAILLAPVGNHSAEFGSSCQLTGLSSIINNIHHLVKKSCIK